MKVLLINTLKCREKCVLDEDTRASRIFENIKNCTKNTTEFWKQSDRD